MSLRTLHATMHDDQLSEARNVWLQYVSKLNQHSLDHELRLSSRVASHRASVNYLVGQMEKLEQSNRPRMLILHFERVRSSQEVPPSKISNLKNFLQSNKSRWESVSFVNTSYVFKASELAKLLEALVGAENLRHLMMRGLGYCGNSLFAHRVKEVLASAPKLRCFQLRCARSSFDFQTEQELGEAFKMNSSLKTLELEECDHSNPIVEDLAESECQLEYLSLRGNGLHSRLWCLDSLVKVVEHQKALTTLNLSENEALLDFVSDREHRKVADFFSALKRHKTLKHVNLGGCRSPRRLLGEALHLFVGNERDADFSVDINGLKLSRNGSDRSLLLGSCSFAIFAQTSDMEAILSQLVEMVNLLGLNQLVLERCLLWGENCGGLIRNYLSSPDCRLKRLELVSCRFCPITSTEIAAGIRSCSSLESLSIRRCEIRRFMVDRLMSNASEHQLTSLRELDLGGNELSFSSLPLLNAFLRRTTNLESLDLSGNHDLLRSGDDEFSKFLELTVNHERLNRLAISRDDANSNMSNELSDVLSALAKNTDSNLRELDLREAGSLEISIDWVKKLPEVESLRVLRLPRGMRNSMLWNFFHIHLHSNQSFTRIDVGGGVTDGVVRKMTRRNALLHKVRALQDIPAKAWPQVLFYLKSNQNEKSPVFEFLRTQNLSEVFPVLS